MATQTSAVRRVKEGFPGQRMLALSPAIIAKALRDHSQLGVLPTDVGYFPAAAGHFVQRPRGIDQLIVIYCTAGAGWCNVSGKRLSMSPGQVLLIGRKQSHAYGADDASPWTIHWMHVAGRCGEAVERLLLDVAAPPMISVGQDVELVRLFEKLFDRLREEVEPDSMLQASFFVAGILQHLIEIRKVMAAEDNLHHRMKRVIHFMWQRINGQVTLDELARVASLSTSHFAARFRQHAAAPPLEYFHRLQMQQAAHLLDNTALPIKAVAARVGYDDPLYFSRRFRRFQGVSPAQYRVARRR